MESRIQGCLGFPHMGRLSFVLRVAAMNSTGSRGGARGAGHPPYFQTKLRPEGAKKFFFEPAPPPFLRVWMTLTPLPPPPTLSEGLDPPPMKVTPKIPILPNSNLNGNHMLLICDSETFQCSIELGEARCKRIVQGSLTLLPSFEFVTSCQKIELSYMRSNGMLIH